MLWLSTLPVIPVEAQQGATDGDAWGTKYAPFDQINGDNFGDLEVAWRWRSADTHLPYESEQGVSLVEAETLFDLLEAADPDRWVTRPSIGRLSATPLMVDGVLYLATPLYQAAAIDARTGETLWVHNPRVYESGSPPLPAPWNHRGVAYWEEGGRRRGSSGAPVTARSRPWMPEPGCSPQSLATTDASTWRTACPRARDNPSRLPPPSRSPPLVVGNTIIVGSSVHDYLSTKENAPGFVRAYDAVSGRHKWDFHNVPQSADEYGADTWQNGAWRYSGNTNTWGNIAADLELGYVYLPTRTPTSDYYGGHRVGDNLFAESLVCVDLETGERVWALPDGASRRLGLRQPDWSNLIDITVDGRRVKAIAQVTKQGFVYTFDRVTGEPIWPIEEASSRYRHRPRR